MAGSVEPWRAGRTGCAVNRALSGVEQAPLQIVVLAALQETALDQVGELGQLGSRVRLSLSRC
jgi:hypothetical protein